MNVRIIDGMDYDSDEEYEKLIWKTYFKQLNEREGFDIKDYPGPRPLATVYPLPCYLHSRKNYKMLKGYAERALKKYNDHKGTKHVVEKVLKVNGGGCCYYNWYLTFSVKTGDEKIDYFQAKVVEDLQGKNSSKGRVEPNGRGLQRWKAYGIGEEKRERRFFHLSYVLSHTGEERAESSVVDADVATAEAEVDATRQRKEQAQIMQR
ncbi:hypothetical protein RND71_005270 [Anisodus tanguticus]|uniref:Uncharacterized protein n=1 Tax=Anisodus tanguticus TaxID=243964 RepID=A0AAE1SNN2_9SOLA|nr:hypothetical protein RND71_005270 [Anisodus tanguticus]